MSANTAEEKETLGVAVEGRHRLSRAISTWRPPRSVHADHALTFPGPRLRGPWQVGISKKVVALLEHGKAWLRDSSTEAWPSDALYEPTDLAQLTAEVTSLFCATFDMPWRFHAVHAGSAQREVYVERRVWTEIIIDLLATLCKGRAREEIRLVLYGLEDQVELCVQDPLAQAPLALGPIQRLVHLHGGTIDTQGRPGQGAIVRLRLPHAVQDTVQAQGQHQVQGRVQDVVQAPDRVSQPAHLPPGTLGAVSMEEGKSYLSAIEQVIGATGSPSLLQGAFTRASRAHFRADRCVYVEFDSGQTTIQQDDHGGPFASIAGVYPLKNSAFFKLATETNQTLAIEDMGRVPWVDEETRDFCNYWRIVALMGAPVYESGELVACLFFTQSVPRQWAPHEAGLAASAARRVRAAVESLRATEGHRTPHGAYGGPKRGWFARRKQQVRSACLRLLALGQLSRVLAATGTKRWLLGILSKEGRPLGQLRR